MIAIPPKSPGLQKIVPALPGFWVDRTLFLDRLPKDCGQDCRPDPKLGCIVVDPSLRQAIAAIRMQSVQF